MEKLVYLIYCIPVFFLLLSRKYNLKFNRLRNTGKIPDIVNSQQRQTLFFLLALLSTMIIFITQN